MIMKQSYRFLQRNIYCRLLLVMSMSLISFLGNAQVSKPSLKKGISQLRSITSNVPSGYSQLGNSTLYYKQTSSSIDLVGQFGNQFYSSTFSNGGYRSAVKIDSNQAVSIDSESGTTDNGVTVKMELVDYNGLAQFKYIVTNTSDTEKTISLGGYADVMIGDNDRAPIVQKTYLDDSTYGLQMKNTNEEMTSSLVLLFGKGMDGVTPIDDYWFGNYGSNSSPEAIAGKYTEGSNWMVENGDYDSALGWCWKERVLSPNSTTIYSVLIGVGDVTLLPMIQNFEVSVRDTAGWNTISNARTFNLSGTYFSPAAHKGVVYYSVDNGEWISLTDSLRSETQIKSTVNNISFKAGEVVHTLRFAVRDQAGANSPYYTVSYREVSSLFVKGMGDMEYTGEPIALPSLSFSDPQSGVTLVPDQQYASYYSDNVNAGVASVHVEGRYPYSIGEHTIHFNILPAEIKGELTLLETSYPYTGKAITPKIQFKDERFGELNGETDYDLYFTDNIRPGTATATLKAKGNFKGEVSVQFEITKKEVEKEDLTFEGFSENVYYDGKPHPVVLEEIAGLGSYTIYYTDSEGNRSTTAPTELGNYSVSIVFEEGDCFKATALENIVNFSIQMMSSIENMIPENGASLSSADVGFSWQGSEHVKSYKFYLWEEGDSQPDRPLVIVRGVQYRNTTFCDYENRYCWMVEGYDSDGNLVSRSEVLTFAINSAPDLHVTGIECGDAWAGQPLDISWTVRNDGKVGTGSSIWYDYIWLVTDLSKGLPDNYTKRVKHLKALVPNEAYTNHVTIPIGERIAGEYYIVVATDMRYVDQIDWSPVGQEIPVPYTPSLDGHPYPYLKARFGMDMVDEGGEKTGYSDNFFYKKINIQVSDLPDFQVLSVVPPTESLSGQSVTVVATIANKGAATKNNAVWYDEIFISTKETFDESAKSLDLVRHQESLAAGGEYQVAFDVKIPAGYSGDYYFFVKTNALNGVYEHALSENNITVSEKTIHVIASPTSDIKALSLEVPATVGVGEPLNIRGKGQNTGLEDTDVSYWKDYVYASLNGELDETAIKIGEIEHYGMLKRNEEYDIEGNVSVLNLEAGDYYIYIKVNGNDRVGDSESDNNVVRSVSKVKIAYPDLVVTDVVVPQFINAGCRYPISYTIQNNGASVVDFTLTDQIHITGLEGEVVKNIGKSHALSLGQGASLIYETELYVPILPEDGEYRLSVQVNQNGKLPESSLVNNVSALTPIRYTRYRTDEDGNPILGDDKNPVVEPVLDLSLHSVYVPSSVLTTSSDFDVSWKVDNVGEATCTAWVTKIYLVVDGKRVLLEEEKGIDLDQGDTFDGEISLMIPDKYASATQLEFEIQVQGSASDGNDEDNAMTVPVSIQSAPLPDLRIKNMQVSSLIAGGMATLTYEVENVGVGETRIDKWNDAVYLTDKTSMVNQVASKDIEKKLMSGDSYKESISFSVPKDYSGNYNLFLKIDGKDLLFEGEDKDNNVMQQFVVVIPPSMSSTDLTIENVSAANSYTVGEAITIRWTIKNSAQNPSVGVLKDAIYLSEDQEWDESDVLVGTVSGNVSLQAGESLERVATGVINSVVPDKYYVVVRTNQLNSINESNYLNNTAASASACRVDFQEFTIGNRVTVDGQGFFKMTADAGESLLLHLEADGTEKGFNLYLAHERVATVTDYDYVSAQPNDPYQETLVPEMKSGTYYILAQQREFVSSVENNFTLGESSLEIDRLRMTLSSEILRFGISRMDKPEGGNGGSATSLVLGAKFDSIMDYRLRRGERILPAEAIYFQNSSESLVTFNLTEEALGTYDVVMEKQGGVKSELKSGYTVVQDSPNKLLTKIISSSSFRSGTINPVTIEYANDGLSDVVVSELLLVSENGHPLGMTSRDVEKGETELRIPIVDPKTNLPMSVAPGGKGTFTVYIYASSLETVSLQLYVIE